MSLYYETAEVLLRSSSGDKDIKSRVYGNRNLKSSAPQVYALAVETLKWSRMLKEVIDKSNLLKIERKLSPILALILVHDLLLSKGGIALPSSHGLRVAVERHKARLTSELTRARIRRRMPSLAALRLQVDADARPRHPRWVRINTLVTSLEEVLQSTFAGFERVVDVRQLFSDNETLVYIDTHIPDLVAISSKVDLTKTPAYRAGSIILQDKASCFPAYLLDPCPTDGEVIDACAAPGNKTTHLAATLSQRIDKSSCCNGQIIHAFEKDPDRAQTLELMVERASADTMCRVYAGQDFLQVDPSAERYKRVGALLLDPSCSGSGIVGRCQAPEAWVPEYTGDDPPGGIKSGRMTRKRGRTGDDETLTGHGNRDSDAPRVNDGLKDRLKALASFQLSLLLHAFTFPAARKITYSTCSVYAEENEQVVMEALRSEVARERGWRILSRPAQVRGMREWPDRGDSVSCQGDSQTADALIKTHLDDGKGVMGFFVAGFIRDVPELAFQENDNNGDLAGGMPHLQETGKPVPLPKNLHAEAPSESEGQSNQGGHCLRDTTGQKSCDEEAMPSLKGARRETEETGLLRASSEGLEIPGLGENSNSDWEGFDD